jgi:acyl-CoA thioester hydrolase
MLRGQSQSVKISNMYVYERRVHVYETDLMGIVHHSNYIRYCEEARVHFLIANGYLDFSNASVFSLTVVGLEFKYIKPLRYGDTFRIQIQFRASGAKFCIQYRITNTEGIVCAIAQTTHCSIDESFKVLRLNQKFISDMVEKNKEMVWTETWL